MAEITIPSPSAFLRPSPPRSTPPPTSAPIATDQYGCRAGSAKAKKKAPRNAVDADNVNSEAGVVKPKQSKSRNGCVTCKAKRLKCGEEKPECKNCKEKNLECGGYKKDFKWKTFEEMNIKQNLDRQKRGRSPRRESATASTGSSQQQSPDSTGGGNPFAPKPKGHLKRDSVVIGNGTHQQQHDISRPSKAKRTSGPPIFNGATSHNRSSSDLVSPQSTSPNSLEFPSPQYGIQQLQPSQLSPPVRPSPTLTEILALPFGDSNSGNQQALPDFIGRNGSLSEPPGIAIDPDLQETQLSVDDLALLDRNEDYESQQDLPLRFRRRSLPNINDGDISEGLTNGVMNYIHPQPFNIQDSEAILAYRFENVTCGILSIMDGPNENPWRTLILPLTAQSPGLHHALRAMTAFHASAEMPELRIVAQEHISKSIRFIKEGIRDNSMGDQTAIATALALGFAESWDQHTATGNTHIKGAQALVKRALERHAQAPVVGEDLARLKFLCNAWVYMDVIVRLTAVDSDESLDFDNTFIFSGTPGDGPVMVMGEDRSGFGIDFGMPIDARLDPLMGCASTLFPIIGRVANLVRKVCRSQVNSPTVISQASDLKSALEAWDLPAFIERPQDPSTDVDHTLQTAEAYRWATLLHLHSSVPELPSISSSELSQRVIRYLATVPLASRTVVVQIYPLMVAGCEASTDDDRQWVRDRWAAMKRRMQLGIIEKCSVVMEEVWRRRDNYEAQPASNRRLVATSELQPTRQPHPLLRTPTGSFRLGDPGRLGMVFSYVEGEDDAHHSDDNEKKKRARERRNGRDPRMGVMDPAYTVRGHLHWVGVMWDWGWECRLSQ